MQHATADSPKPARQLGPGDSLIVGLVLAAMTAFVIASIVNAIRTGGASANWPTTQGTVIRSQAWFDGEDYQAGIVYRYSVGGKYYQSARVGFAVASSTEERAKDVVARYPLGAKVLVHYDADRPEEALLEPGVDLFDPCIGGGLTALTLGYCAAGLLIGWWKRRAG